MPRNGQLLASARTVRWWCVLCGVVVLSYLAALLRRHSGYSLAVDGLLYVGGYVVAALCCAARARRAGNDARIWRLFAIGIALYAGGWAAVAHWLPHDGIQPIPSIADVGWLGLYPVFFVAICIIMRRLRTERTSVLTAVDAIVAGLGASAVCAAFVLPSLAAAPHTSWPVTLTDAAYPIGDLLLLAITVATLLVGRFDVPPAVWVLTGAIIVMICCDCVYLTDVAAGHVQWGSWADGGSLLALSTVSMCAGTRFAPRPARAAVSWPAQTVPAVATLSGLVILLCHKNGRFHAIVAALAAMTIAVAVVRLLVSHREIRSLAVSRLLAETDELTGLPNRRGFQDAASKILAATLSPLAVLLIDLDGFKDVNDTLGHPTGDELLRALGRRLDDARQDCADCHMGDAAPLIARIGGDEFAVLADDTDALANRVAARILDTIRQPFDMDGMELRIDASIGIASAPQHGATLEDLLRHADIAMYRAKARHRGISRYAADAEESRSTLRTIAELRYALESDPSQLVLHYQPKVHLLSRRMDGVEALVRWQHPDRGLLMPSEFLPLAEKAHLMQLLTVRVLERALADASTWQCELSGQTVAVNLPADAVADNSLVQQVAALLRSTDTPAHRLQLEITEDFLMADLAGARVVLEKLRALGVRISIDDYGTGYSSLAYLRDLPVDELKLDRAFVQPILSDQRAAAIVRSTIELAHSLGLRMVAEGIEDADTCHRLLAMGCDVGQGYLFGGPQPATELERTLASPTSIWTPSARPPEYLLRG